MGGKATTPVVFAYLADRQGKLVDIDHVVNDTGLSRSQVQAAMISLTKKHSEIEVLQRGIMWRLNGATATNGTAPDLPPVGAMFELVGFGEGGALVLRDENAIMYTARKARL